MLLSEEQELQLIDGKRRGNALVKRQSGGKASLPATLLLHEMVVCHVGRILVLNFASYYS